jgi:hypothetical protein
MDEKTVAKVEQKDIGFLAPTSLAEALAVSEALAKSDIVPTEYKAKPGNILVALGMGQSVGLNPMQSLQSICVINGKPSMWGDAVLGIVKNSGLEEYTEETYEPSSQTATCKTKRRGDPVEVVRSFSMDDAKRAGLLGKTTWQSYPRRMLQCRARAWALRDKYPDLLKGLQVREEVEDYTDTTAETPEPLPLRKSELSASTPAESQAAPAVEVITAEERKVVAEMAIDKGFTPPVMKELLKRRYGIDSSAQLPKAKLAELRDILTNGEPPEAA